MEPTICLMVKFPSLLASIKYRVRCVPGQLAKAYLGKIVFSISVVTMPKKGSKHGKKVVLEVKKVNKQNKKIKSIKPIPNVLAKLPNNQPSYAVGRTEVSLATAAALLQPFKAYEAQVALGLPFDETGAPHFSFWTRDIQVVNAVPLTGGVSGYGAFAVALPWHEDALSCGTVIAASGAITTINHVSCLASNFITSNFEKGVVTHMGMRVRNITAVIGQSGDLTVGQSIFESVFAATGAQRRNNQLSYSRAAPGSEVIGEVVWIGDSDSDELKDPTISDYNFSDVSGSTYGNDTSCIYFQSFGPDNASFEIEVVRHWLLTPSLSIAAFIPLSRQTVNVPKVLDILDACYARVPRFDMRRCAIRDDAGPIEDLKGVWNGFKSLVRLPGSLWQSMQGVMGAHSSDAVLKDLVKRIPPDMFKQVVSYLSKYVDQKSALADIGKDALFVDCTSSMKDFKRK